MRELDTTSPVIWPSWCYTGFGESDLELKQGGLLSPFRMNGASPSATGPDEHHIYAANNNNNNIATVSNKNGSVKSERLSPSAPDNNSSSSRSTPVSYEGTPAITNPSASSGSSSDLQASSPINAKTINSAVEFNQSTSRNYSDFMRSLAAKYNHANPNDYMGTAYPARNGFLADSKFAGGFKMGVPSPLPTGSAVPPSAGVGISKESSPSDVKSSSSESAAAFLSGSPFIQPGGIVSPLFPPIMDMSSTQALLTMVRTASAHSAQQLETYLKGAMKRGSGENPLDLSASKKSRRSAAIANLSIGESLYGDAFPAMPAFNYLSRVAAAAKDNRTSLSKSPKPPTTSSNNNASISASQNNSNKPNLKNVNSITNISNSINNSNNNNNSNCNSGNLVSNSNNNNNNSVELNRPNVACSSGPHLQCRIPSMCTLNSFSASCDKTLLNLNPMLLCGASTGLNSLLLTNNISNCNSNVDSKHVDISNWSIDDVATFVSSIDICAEYVNNFVEQRIDGSALVLLTESHLTSALKMKLGPALKMRAAVNNKLGHCSVCLHCVHCHAQLQPPPTTTTSEHRSSPRPTTTHPSSSRPSSAGGGGGGASTPPN